MQRGKLIYLVGPSGSGKDSLLEGIKKNKQENLYVARRFITRPTDDKNETHIAITQEKFNAYVNQNFFSMYWLANGLSYGISQSIHFVREEGCNVIVNGSREYVAKLLTKYPEAIVVNIKVSLETLKQRLTERQRETSEQISHRLQRAALDYNLPNNSYHIDNNGSLQQAVNQLQEIIEEA